MELEEALVNGVREVVRCRGEGWRDASGQSLDPTLERMEARLTKSLTAVRAGQEPEWNQLRHRVRFVADWIPDLSDPLLNAMARIDLVVEGSRPRGADSSCAG